jgi:hypothetical protein
MAVTVAAVGEDMAPQPFDSMDSRWVLVQEVVASSLFEKSPRLRAFLLYVAEMELSGRRHEINEQHIGTHVFGRPLDYNPGDDSIVRSQARFLRQRLREYFATTGAGSALTIEIPKGSYVPIFEARDANQSAAPLPEEITPEPAPEPVGLPTKKLPLLWIVALAAAVLVAAGGGAFWIYTSHHEASDRFWATLFSPHRTQLIVPADSTLILIEELTGKEVSFSSYLHQEYLSKSDLQQVAPHLESSDLENSHYTSMADLRLVARLYRQPQIDAQHTQIRYARELSLSDAREDDLILIGGSRANPWVTLFSAQMNFSVDYDAALRQNRVSNRAPRAGERASYAENATEANRTVYGLVAYVPSLDRQGHVLMVAGTSSAGTQVAADFLLSGPPLNSFLQRVQRADKSIPSFELLLEGHSLNGNATSSSIVAFRILP